MNKFINNKKFLSVFFSVLVSVFAVALITYATSIGTDVSVTGALTVTGASTMTGATTLNGAVTLGDAAADTITVNGSIAGFLSTASSTVNSTLVVTTSLGVATSTPSQELGVTGDIIVGSSATTTIFTSSTSATQGTCVQLQSAAGALYRVYVSNVGVLTTATGTCR
ncbi:MAG: hypothetical protein Q8P07_06420 [bacterium]|nr:hypothetical protein [bacterium]